jgi:hypothetical protein
MSASYDEDERPSRLTHVIYNVTLGHVRVRSEDGPATTVEVPPGEVRFRRVLGAVEPETALWLAGAEQEYLARMVEHVLTGVKISPEARATLEAVQEKLVALAPHPLEPADVAAAVLEPTEEAEGPTDEPRDSRADLLVPAEPDRAEAAEPVPPAAEPAAAEPAAAVSDTRPPPVPTLFPPLPGRPASEPPVPGEASPAVASVETPAPAALTAEDTRQRSAIPRATTRARQQPGSGQAAAPRGATRREPAAGTPASGGRSRREEARRPAEPASVAPATPGPAPGQPIPFATVWADLQALSARRTPLHRLAGQTSSEIRDIDEDGVWLYSNSLNRTYQVTRDLLERAWTNLVTTGRLVPREVRMNYGAVTLLAHLPYVEYSIDPVTLYYPAATLHPLGSVRLRGDED